MSPFINIQEWFLLCLFWICFFNFVIVGSFRLLSFGLSHVILDTILPYIPSRYKSMPLVVNMTREDWTGCEVLGKVYIACIDRVVTIYKDPQDPAHFSISLLARPIDDRARG